MILEPVMAALSPNTKWTPGGSSHVMAFEGGG